MTVFVILFAVLRAATPADQPATRPLVAGNGFVVPDLPDNASKYTSYEGRWVTARFAMVALVDYNWFVQDDASREQVGEQKDQWDARTWRLMARGGLRTDHPIDYFISVEIKGRDHVQGDDDSKWGFTDFEISTPVGPFGRLRVGKIKEPFVYEMVGDAANLQQQERALSPFFASRGIGARLAKSFANDRLSWSFGWYNDWWIADQAFERSGNNFAARLTALPHWVDPGNYLHVGVAGRYVGADDGALRLRGRPESNVSAYYVDSGSLAGDHANELGLESVWGRGPLMVSAEYARAWLAAPDSGDPRFWGAYLAASYVLTGEHRSYDRSVSYARRVLPVTKWGAWEVVGRYSHVDITDRLVDGGIFDRATVGLNWWATRRWKFGFDYGRIDHDRFGQTGRTDAFHWRFQWIY